jgi:hypothetical protein
MGSNGLQEHKEMMRKTRVIAPEQICIGDTIVVSSMGGDVVTTKSGKIASRNHEPHGTSYETAEGQILLYVFRSRHTSPAGAHVTLLERKASYQPMLDGVNV